MKDGIKEILQLIGSCCYYGKISEDKCEKYCNYITNLQEESKKQEELISRLYNIIDDDKENFKLLDEENKRLKEELQQEKKDFKETNDYCFELKDYKSRNEKANTLLDEMLERTYIDGKYIMYDYSTSELLEVKNALQGEDKE